VARETKRVTKAPIPVGIVGGGKHGERYLRHIAEDVPELAVRLVSRRDPVRGEEQARRAGARYVRDFRELATSPEIEAVIATAPPTLNAELAALAAGARKAMLIEKPLAPTVAACRSIRDAVERASVPVMVGQTLRFDSVVRTVAAALRDLGPVHQVCLTQRFEPSPLGWLDDPAVAGGGNLLHTGIHGFDLVRHLTGAEPTSALAVTRRIVTRETEDDFAAIFSFDGPLVASVAGSRATDGRSGTIEVAAERGQIAADHVHSFAYRIRGLERTALDVGPRLPTVRAALRAFVRMLRDGEPAAITVDDGLRAVAMAEACYRSAASGRAEKIEAR
jgi:predicted dehydrogenase